MADMNTVNLTGRISSDVVLKKTTTGLSVLNFSIAVDRPKASGETAKKTDFFTVIAWRKLAEIVSQYACKGVCIGVTGRLQQRGYVDKAGGKHSVVEILADEIHILESRAQVEARKAGAGSAYAPASHEDVETLNFADEDLPL